jgi:ATP-dependent exoDNAse (exonuclease V) alpha subunit
MVERTGGKLILVGDSAQLSPIGAGSGLDLIKKALSPIELDEIKRQSTAPQRRLVDSLVAVANTSQDRGQAVAAQAAQSLAKTLQEGCAWTSHPRSKEAVQDVAERVAAEIDPNSVVPGRLVALARSHRETQYVSRLVRAILRKRGDLEGEDLPLKAITPTGLKYSLKIAKGDRVRFLTRLRKHEIFNGTQGVIDEINQEASIRVRLTEPSHGNTSRYVDIAISELHDDNEHVRLACDYATTVFSSQGATYDEVVVLKARSMRFRELYVALTRARHEARVVDVNPVRAAIGADNLRSSISLGSITRDLLESKRRDKPRVLALDAHIAGRRNAPVPRTEWLWDPLVLERQAR